jgi:hypothetical protein
MSISLEDFLTRLERSTRLDSGADGFLRFTALVSALRHDKLAEAFISSPSSVIGSGYSRLMCKNLVKF